MTIDDEYDEFDDIDGEDADNTLSGLMVLFMGMVVLGAIFAVAWMSYQYGVRSRPFTDGQRYVTADPEPIKIRNPAVDDTDDNRDRAVFDQFDGAPDEPVEVIAEGPEEPVARNLDDPISSIVAEADAGVTDDAVADRIAELARADEALQQGDAPAEDNQAPEAAPSLKPTTSEPTNARPVVEPTPTSATLSEAASTEARASAAVSALSGTHLVQVGAVRSEDEANATWSRLQSKLGDFAAGKTTDYERADLGDRGIYYRIRLGPFASRDSAITFCEGLKERGQDCLVKAK